MKITDLKNKYNKQGQLRRRGYMIFLLLVVCCFIGGIVARYIHRTQSWTSQITAENFYFTANLLGDTRMVPTDGTLQEQYSFGEKSTEGVWDLYGSGKHQITIRIQNYYDELRVTEKDIRYTGEISVKKADGSEVKAGASNFPVLKKEDNTFQKGKLSGNTQSEDTIVAEIPSGSDWAYEDGDTVIVKIKSTSPYKKTLTMKFVLHMTDATLKYKVVDSAGSPYAELILMTDVDEPIQPYLTWPRELSIDNTNPLTFTYDEQGNFSQQSGMSERNMQLSEKLETGRSESIYFFKEDTSKDYSCKEKTVNAGSDGRYVIDLNK